MCHFEGCAGYVDFKYLSDKFDLEEIVPESYSTDPGEIKGVN